MKGVMQDFKEQKPTAGKLGVGLQGAPHLWAGVVQPKFGRGAVTLCECPVRPPKPRAPQLARDV